MKRDYLAFRYGISKIESLKKGILLLVLLFSASFAFAQQTATIVTTSTDLIWQINFQNSGGLAFNWQATGPSIATQNGTGNNPQFDFSANDGSDITIVITSDDDFDFTTVLLAPGRDITSIDLSNLDNLRTLEMPSNLLMTIDVSANINLERLELNNNNLATINLASNINLEEFDASFNDLATVDITGLTGLEFLDVSNNQLIALDLTNNNLLRQINLDFNLLPTAVIGQIIVEVDSYGTGAFGYILSLTGNPGDIPASSIPSLNNLLARQWIVRPPVIYDFGDAPNSYLTSLASGGPQHIIGDGDLNLGSVFDDEFDGFPGVDADGDDNDNVNDEDGVNPTDLLGISTSTDNFNLDVTYTNNTPSAANLYGWIDFDGSGSFEVDEFATVAVPNGGSGTVTISWTNLVANGVDIVEGNTYARFRTTSDILTGNDPAGIVNNGEVEDYFLVIQLDTDRDGVPDDVDLDDDNDGILDSVENQGGAVDIDTDGDGTPDRIELDSDKDGCFDVDENLYDNNGINQVGTLNPATVDVDGVVTSLGPNGGYGTPEDQNTSGTPDFQEVGAVATITTQPTDQDLIIGDVTFTVVSDLVAGDEFYQWEESIDGGLNWGLIVDNPGEYAGANTASLVVTNTDVTRLTHRYRVLVRNIAFACDLGTYSDEVTYIIPLDTDSDGVFDIVDLDDDNDGILDSVENQGGAVDIDTDGDGTPDRIELDSDKDGCFDVDENLYDNNGINQVGTLNPATVDVDGVVTSLGPNGGYGTPEDQNTSGTPDFQEVGAVATITTQPTDQDLIIGDVTFTVVSDLVAGDEFYQWEESIDGGLNWGLIVDNPGEYAGANTASLVVTNTDVTRLTHRYRVLVRNIAFACDLGTYSDEVTYIIPLDTDSDGVFDIVDLDDDNDGILDSVENQGGAVDIDTDGDGTPDRIELDSDKDGCFDVDENLYDNNGINQVGTLNPATVDVDGVVTSLGPNGGYGTPEDQNTSGTPDFQEAGAAATITTQPVNQDLVIGVTTFSVVATADTYQWQEDKQDGNGFVDVINGGDYAGATTANLEITNADFTKVRYEYQVIVSNISYACDPTTTSVAVTYINPDDFDKDGVPDLVDDDDDNDGILDIVENQGGAVDIDTDGDGTPDRIELDSDKDGCFDVDENLYDNNGINEVGNQNPPVVDAAGVVTSLGPNGGYGTPEDQDGNGTPDFQEAGAAATITTQPTDQNLVLGVSTFSVVATADTYQWEESTDGGANWVALSDGGDYAGTTTADLQVSNSDVSKITYRYRVNVNNVAYACDPVTTSVEVRFTALNDFDNDGVFDLVDDDDDNDGILDTVEDNGVVDRDTDGDGTPDRIELDSDKDGCFDVDENLYDNNGINQVGTQNPAVVDAAGVVTSLGPNGGYGVPEDQDVNGIADFQEAGAAAAISTQPVAQNFVPATSVIFSVVASADTYQWEESQDGGSTWAPLADGGNYAGSATADLTVSNLDVSMIAYQYRVMVNNIAYACDPVTTSDEVGFVLLTDTDNDGVPDLVDDDDDNDGILDTVEDRGVVDRDTDGDGTPDRIELDSDKDGCFDVDENLYDNNGINQVGNQNPAVVDAAGVVTSLGTNGGYGTPVDGNNNGTPDFQEAGTGASVTTQPTDQDFVLNGSAIFTVIGDGGGYQWQVSTDGTNWVDLSDDATYSGTTTTSLTVSNLVIANYFEFYRAIVTNVAYACDPGDVSDTVTYNTLADTDNDGVFDIVDDDDDNDGILDTVEDNGVVDRDTDNDGDPDRIDLDADGDNCFDVDENLYDNNGVNQVGTQNPAVVDAAGVVTSLGPNGGYGTPVDGDNNGTPDFQEAGSPSVITSQPIDTTISLGEDAIFEIQGDATFYRWEESMNGGSTWNILVDNDIYSGVETQRLTISGARGRLEGNLYRIVLTSPDYACDPNVELISDAVRLIFDTAIIPSGFSPNGDGSNDLFSVPGLIETPDFTMEVFDRWGNSVYKYKNNGNLSPDWWDGRSTGNMTLSKGELVPAGTYFYLIDFKDGDKSPAKGWVYVNY